MSLMMCSLFMLDAISERLVHSLCATLNSNVWYVMKFDLVSNESYDDFQVCWTWPHLIANLV